MSIHEISKAGTFAEIGMLHDVQAAGSYFLIGKVHDRTVAGTSSLIWTAAPPYLFNNGFQTDGITSLTNYENYYYGVPSYNLNNAMYMKTADNNTVSWGKVRSNLIDFSGINSLTIGAEIEWRNTQLTELIAARFSYSIAISKNATLGYTGETDANPVYLVGDVNAYGVKVQRWYSEYQKAAWNPVMNTANLNGNYYVHMFCYSYVAHGSLTIKTIKTA